MLGGITCPNKNKNTGNEIENPMLDLRILDGNFAACSSVLILFFNMCTVRAPIPRPKNAIEIAIKA
jgi:hypothetical protein